jgi:hypothetical protein
MMLQSMRSGTIARPGETVGCVGCHEDRRSSASTRLSGHAVRRPPNYLQPWYGPSRLFSFTTEVQPVLDKHCVTCHDYGQAAGDKLNLAGDLGLVFNTAYVELRGKGYVQVVGAGPFSIQPPMSWGSHASRLIQVLNNGHGEPDIDRQVHLDRESFQRIVTWIDINAPYYPSYAGGAYRDHPFGRSPLTKSEVKRLSELTGRNLLEKDQFTQISFTRPEVSPCLIGIAADRPGDYEEALALVQRGARRLAARPREDMPGCELVSPTEITQQRKYTALQAESP